MPITPVWKLSYKNHIQGQEEQSIMLVLIAIYTKARNKNYYDTIAPKFSSPLLRARLRYASGDRDTVLARKRAEIEIGGIYGEGNERESRCSRSE